jgi:ABC-type oligopeptide transport system ATPase subunit
MPSTNKVLRVRNLHITYGEGSHKKTAVKNVTFDVKKGEILGLVGESGSGKTTIGKAIAQIIPIAGGNVYFNNKLIFGPPPLINKNFKKIINDLRYLKHDCFMLKKILEKISQNEKNITVHSVKNLRIMVEKSIINVEGL